MKLLEWPINLALKTLVIRFLLKAKLHFLNLEMPGLMILIYLHAEQILS